MKPAIAAGAALLCLAGAVLTYVIVSPMQPEPEQDEGYSALAAGAGTVQSVYDGDTFTLSTGEKVRVLGIDTPELKPAECYGTQARNATASAIDGKEVVLTTDPRQGDKDRYGRLLRYVQTPDGSDLAAVLLRGGFARVYQEYPVARTGEYLVLQAQAEQDGEGLWSVCPGR